jgi:hypothetical protein
MTKNKRKVVALKAKIMQWREERSEHLKKADELYEAILLAMEEMREIIDNKEQK